MQEPIRYTVSIRAPRTHRVEVTVEIPREVRGELSLALPCWTPGSYLMREFARQIERVEAWSGEQALACEKVTKETWRVTTAQGGGARVRYWLNAQELGVRQPYLDDRFGFFLGTNLLMVVEQEQERAVEVGFELPPRWRVICPKVEGFVTGEEGFGCAGYDALADTILLLGEQEVECFEVMGREHGLAVSGPCRLDRARLVEEITRLLPETASIFGGELPYERYLFVLLVSDSTRGGLEHLDSVALIYPRAAFRREEAHRDFLTLVSHEFFHVWNVKRIVTDALRPPFDYRREAYTRDLWVAEGWTVYYEYLTLLRAGLVPLDWVLGELAKMIHRYERLPGRRVQSLEASSFDAWIKLYRRDGHSPNATISYYHKGALVAWLLDLEIRRQTDNARGLDDVLGYLWERFASEGAGYPERTMQRQVEAAVGGDFADFFARHVHGVDDVDWEGPLARVGLTLMPERADDAPPSLGVAFEPTTLTARTVWRDGPGEAAGLMMGDTLLSIDRMRARPHTLTEMLQGYAPGDAVDVHFWREGLLCERRLVLGEPEREGFCLAPLEEPGEAQRAAFAAWIGRPLPAPGED